MSLNQTQIRGTWLSAEWSCSASTAGRGGVTRSTHSSLSGTQIQMAMFASWNVQLQFIRTCRALNMRHSFLPLAAPGKGVAESSWAAYWCQAREELGIEDLNVFPLMTVPDEEAVPTVRPLSTAEAGKWLQVILMQQGAKLSEQSSVQYTTHSFKATCLSYLAKYGCSFEDRLALGYHSDQVRMALRYSRDGASRPLRVLEECLSAIRQNQFFSR